jgi:hypothetical protein
MKYFPAVFLLAGSIFFAAMAKGQTQKAGLNLPCITEAQWQKLPAHPRLYANDARIVSLKKQKDQLTKDLLLLLKADAEKKL